MHQFFDYLNNPQLVADFQKVFGLEWEFDHHSSDAGGSDTLINKNGGVKPDQNNNTSDASAQTQNSTSVTFKRGHTKTNSVVSDTDHSHIVSKTIITKKFWYYFFHVGAAMGNEIFYSIFFPCWFWNVDGAIARKITLVWGIFMYIGQATKDIMCMPRPASPPVVKLEKRYVLEYGFPSTHAMCAFGLPTSLVLLSDGRYNIDLKISLLVAMLFCFWVCSSRLYLGMHSLLDVIAGVVFGAFVLAFTIPILEPIDNFIMNYEPASISILIPLGLLICYSYPTVKRWSTTRSDTATVIGCVVGFSIGASLNNYMGLLDKPDKPPLYDIRYPDAFGWSVVVFRTILGMVVLVAYRTISKPIWKRLLCAIFFQDRKDVECLRKKRIEIPLSYFTYLILGFNVTFSSPYLFRLLNIQRDYSYTEL